MRKYLTTILLASTFLIAEIHTFWERSSIAPVNWIYAREVPMSVQWNIKLAGLQLIYIIYGLALLCYVPNRVNRTTAITFTIFCVVDTALYFYNYKTFNYGYVYFFVALFWLVLFYWYRITSIFRKNRLK